MKKTILILTVATMMAFGIYSCKKDQKKFQPAMGSEKPTPSAALNSFDPDEMSDEDAATFLSQFFQEIEDEYINEDMNVEKALLGIESKLNYDFGSFYLAYEDSSLIDSTYTISSSVNIAIDIESGYTANSDGILAAFNSIKTEIENFNIESNERFAYVDIELEDGELTDNIFSVSFTIKKDIILGNQNQLCTNMGANNYGVYSSIGTIFSKLNQILRNNYCSGMERYCAINPSNNAAFNLIKRDFDSRNYPNNSSSPYYNSTYASTSPLVLPCFKAQGSSISLDTYDATQSNWFRTNFLSIVRSAPLKPYNYRTYEYQVTSNSNNISGTFFYTSVGKLVYYRCLEIATP